ncbi:MAG: acetyl-CoA acetyltransferase [Pseudomonadales bacterium]
MSEVPVLIGVAQIEQRIDEAGTGKEPFELMLDAVNAAAADTGATKVLDAATSVRVVRGVWPYKNPAAAVAEAIGVGHAESALTPFGGNYVQSTVNQSCLDIQAGKHSVIVLTGAECGNSQAKARRAGIDLDWQTLPGTPDRMIGKIQPMRSDAEKAAGINDPIQVYPLFEIALRHHLGEGVEEHLARVSQLWAGFSAVAANNPHAWIREALTAEQIRTPSAKNRPISYPYPKFMNSNSNVDQGAALILCSTSKARALGVPQDKWVYPYVGTDAHDHLYVSERDTLYDSPAIRLAGNRALELANLGPADLDMVDVYSCFPVAVQVAARALGLDQNKPLTVTGGLTFAGGPLNNYVMHAIARSADLLRAQPGSKGLVTANGGFLTKHAFGVYSTEPPAQPFQHQDLQAQVDLLPKRKLDMSYSGPASVESYAVMYGPTDVNQAIVACRLPDGARAWATTEDRDTLIAMTESEFCGREVRIKDHKARF